MAADEKKVKDLTGIMEYSREMEKQGKAPPIPEGSIMEEVKIDKIDDFESLTEYSKTNPAAEPPPEDEEPPPPEPAPAQAAPPPPAPEAPPAEVAAAPEPTSADDAFVTTATNPEPSPDGMSGLTEAMNPEVAAASSESTDFPTSPESAPSDQGMSDNAGSEYSNAVTGALADNPLAMDGLADALPGGAPPPPENLGGITHTEVGGGGDAPAAEFAPPADASAVEPPAEAPAALPTDLSTGALSAPPPPSTEPQSQAMATPTPVPPPGPPQTAMQRIKQYSEKLSVGKPVVAAAYPFSLLITGKLAPEEREKLLDVLSRENMGFREVDLEPQFEGDRVLIPRISEYAGVVLVQALRGTRAQIKFGPADQIFATAETRASEEETSAASEEQATVYSSDIEHPAERLPLTPESTLPALPHYVVVDVVTASASLKTQVVEAESSSEYQEILEALQRELKYKAYRKGASAVLNFAIQLTNLSMPTLYRITTLGSAVRAPGVQDLVPTAAPPSGPPAPPAGKPPETGQS